MSKRKKSDTPSPSSHIVKRRSKWSVASFAITNDFIRKFRRFIKNPMDCVINALQLINLIDTRTAEIMRICVTKGISLEQIEMIFTKVIKPDVKWRFKEYRSIKPLVLYAIEDLKPAYAMFCGYNVDGQRHVFLIVKTDDNKIYYLDPQVDKICDLSEYECFAYIAEATSYYILEVS